MEGLTVAWRCSERQLSRSGTAKLLLENSAYLEMVKQARTEMYDADRSTKLPGTILSLWGT